MAQTLDSRCLESLASQPSAAPLLWSAEDSTVQKVQEDGGGLQRRCADCQLWLILESPCYGTLCVAKAITTASQHIAAWESPRAAAGALINNSSREFSCSCPHCLRDILCSVCMSAPKDPTSETAIRYLCCLVILCCIHKSQAPPIIFTFPSH